MGASTKCQSPATSEPTSEHNKRTRGLSSTARGSNASNLSSVSVPETVLESQTSNKTARIGEVEMGEILKHELCGQVFLHKKFFDEFLPLSEAVRTEVRDRIVSSGALQP
ncbi:hypothetical protein FRC10_005554, partial [Ceratobasidium sp. 414]